MAEARSEPNVSGQTEVPREVTRQRSIAILGVPISWIAIVGSLVGVGTLIQVEILFVAPVGDHFQLSTVLAPLVGLVLGPYGGFAAAILGGIIGMFLNPAAYYMGVGNIMDLGMAALATGWIINKKWHWTAIMYVTMIVAYNIVPFYILNIYTPPIDPAVHLAMWFYYAGFGFLLSLGWNILPSWARSENPGKLFVATWILTWIGVAPGHLLGWIAYDVLFSFPMALNVIVGATVMPRQRLFILTVGALISSAVLIALRRTGLRKIPRAAW
ncbi:MAG TPA: hypothetical protein VJ574_08110 [Candidatus Bathyarchaeia archaeon]|nr:hypothetical protein [Candidatus Bathyarchaeia archaeon]